MTPITGEARLETRGLLRALHESSLVLRLRWVVHATLVVLVALSVQREGERALLPAVAAVAFWIGGSALAQRWSVRRILRDLGADRGPVRYVFDADQFTVSGPNSTSTVSYDSVREFREGRVAFFLRMRDQNDFYLVPKDAFSAPDLSALRGLLKGKLRTGPLEMLSEIGHLVLVLVGVAGAAWLLIHRLGR